MLPAARNMYLVVAFGSLLAIVIGVVFAVYLQIIISTPVIEKPVHPTSQGLAINLDTVSSHLAPPTHIRFMVTRTPIDQPLVGDDIIGYFDAQTANGLARFPDDFDILGGTDAALFDRAPLYSAPTGSSITTPRAGLKATAALIQQINQFVTGQQAPRQQIFSLKVIARDVYGNRSVPADISFTLTYAPPAATSTAPVASMSDLQRLARDIALVLDPKRTPAYFDAYKRAVAIPKQCGTTDDDHIFVSSYRQAFEQLRSKLNAGNIEAFYAGVCDAWGQAVSQANAERDKAIAENMAAQAQAEMAKSAATLARNQTITFVAGAISLFLVISLFLAFLAIENHSKAMRQAIEVIANERRT